MSSAFDRPAVGTYTSSLPKRRIKAADTARQQAKRFLSMAAGRFVEFGTTIGGTRSLASSRRLHARGHGPSCAPMTMSSQPISGSWQDLPPLTKSQSPLPPPPLLPLLSLTPVRLRQCSRAGGS
ncbi:hypothetical protein Mapa_003340 [Marchantia paleacea]|nr:hypothetical protein Mapa_003340 [Marchantia paleacea]